MGERVAIVGSRDWPSEMLPIVRAAIRAYVLELPKDSVVVSGDARGVDTWAKDAADEAGLGYSGWPPRYDLYPAKIAPIIRNKDIVRDCDRLVAFQFRKSSGTQDAVDYAKSLGKGVRTFSEDELRAREVREDD